MAEARALLDADAARRRADLADLALAVYAAVAAAQGGPAAYRALLDWVAQQRGEPCADAQVVEL